MLHHGIHDFKHGRRSPIYGVALSLNQWAAAELRIEGVVTIKNGTIEKHDQMLREALDRIYKIMERSHISDGAHVVARYFFQQNPFHACSWNPPTPPVCKLIESLMRICVGDRILNWNLQQIKLKFAAYHQAIANEIIT